MTWVLIVASGEGKRFGTQIPKQFLDLEGIPVVGWSILAFKKALPNTRILLTIPKGKEYTSLAQSRLGKILELCDGLVEGGSHRQESVFKGLNWLNKYYDDGKILIHDGVRPFVSIELIKRVYEKIEKGMATVPTIKPSDSVRIQNQHINKPIDRDLVHLVQTPQGFYLSDLLDKLNKLSESYSTDEASLFGSKVHIVEGDRLNIKITYHHDLIIAKSLIASGVVEKHTIYGR